MFTDETLFLDLKAKKRITYDSTVKQHLKKILNELFLNCSLFKHCCVFALGVLSVVFFHLVNSFQKP